MIIVIPTSRTCCTVPTIATLGRPETIATPTLPPSGSPRATGSRNKVNTSFITAFLFMLFISAICEVVKWLISRILIYRIRQRGLDQERSCKLGCEVDHVRRSTAEDQVHDSDDDFRSGCWNVGHCHQQQSFSGQLSPKHNPNKPQSPGVSPTLFGTVMWVL